MADMEGLIDGPLAQVMAAERERLNSEFAQARRALPRLEPELFATVLRRTLAPIAAAVNRAQYERTRATMLQLYSLALELTGHSLLGPGAKNQAIESAWQRLLTAVPLLVVKGPRAVAALVTNAVHNLCFWSGVSVTNWVEGMARLGSGCETVEEFRQVGQVLSWLCGMAHYRAGALATCRQMPERLARVALDIADESVSLSKVVQRLDENPWLLPAHAASDSAPPPKARMVRLIGGFRGFGGPFISPPAVSEINGGVVIRDTERSWLLEADIFGAILLPSTDTPSSAHPPSRSCRIEGQSVSWNDSQIDFDGPLQPVSAGGTRHMLAVSFANSHMIGIVARVADGAIARSGLVFCC
jgi:hypothetical protein